MLKSHPSPVDGSVSAANLSSVSAKAAIHPGDPQDDQQCGEQIGRRGRGRRIHRGYRTGRIGALGMRAIIGAVGPKIPRRHQKVYRANTGPQEIDRVPRMDATGHLLHHDATDGRSEGFTRVG